MRIDLTRRLTPDEADCMIGEQASALPATLLEPGTVIYDTDTGMPILGYMPLDEPGPLRRALLTVDCGHGVQRNKNYRSRSRTFGYAPRRPVLWRESCAPASLSREQPEVEAVLETYADQFAHTLKTIAPQVAENDRVTLGGVLPEWRIGTEKLWTSGVINDTAQLPYHRDGFNFPTWSAMPVVRRAVRGGGLHLPEWGIVVPCADSTVTLFEGSKWIHGVTPITRLKKGQGYRISVVYYALSGMKNCREAAEEAALGRVRRTEREKAMARRLAEGDTAIPGTAGRAATRRAMAAWRNTGTGDAYWPGDPPKS